MKNIPFNLIRVGASALLLTLSLQASQDVYIPDLNAYLYGGTDVLVSTNTNIKDLNIPNPSGLTPYFALVMAPSLSLGLDNSQMGGIWLLSSSKSPAPSILAISNSHITNRGGYAIVDSGENDTVALNNTIVTQTAPGTSAIQVGGGRVQAPGAVSTVIVTNRTIVTGPNAVSFNSGSTEPEFSAGQRVLQVSDHSTLNGNVFNSSGTLKASFSASSTLNGALSGSNIDAIFTGGSTWSGWAAGTVRDIAIDATSAWYNTKPSTLGSLELAGNICFLSTVPGTRLTVGKLTGNNGTITMFSSLGDDNSPTQSIAVTSAATGTTHLDIVNTDGRGAQTTNGIRVVSTQGASVAANAFDLSGGQKVVGLYTYTLDQGYDKNYYLTSRPALDTLYPPVVPGLAQSYCRTILASYLDHPGALRQLWTKVVVENNEIAPAVDISGTSKLYVLQAGSDLYRCDNWRYGAYVGYGKNQVATNSGATDFRNANIAAYANTAGKYGWVEFSIQQTRLKQDTTFRGETLSSSGSDCLFAIEVGHDFTHGGCTFTPLLQLIDQGTTLGVAAGPTITASWENTHAVTAKYGFRASCIPKKGFLLWAKIMANDVLLGKSAVALEMNGTGLIANGDTTGITILSEIGVECAIGHRNILFAAAGFETGSMSHGSRANVGLRHQF